MAKRKTGKTVTVIAVVVILFISAIITHFFSDSWDEEYMQAGLRSDTSVSEDMMYVSFIDVGQGDSTLITCGETAILVDGGENGEAQTVINYIKNHNVDDIDCLIATHPHSDHIGSLSEVITEFEVKNIIMPEIPEKIIPTTVTYERFLTAVSKNDGNVIKANAGSTYTYGDVTVEILAPIDYYNDLNNMSVVSRISYSDTSVILMGDAAFDSENDILDKKSDCAADLIKIGHHGSRTSTSDKLLDAINPEYAVISCAIDNDYGHPHKELLSRLEKHSVAYYRTDLLGNIVFVSDGKTISKVA